MLDMIDYVDVDFRVLYGIEGVGDGYIPGYLTGPRFVRMCEALLYTAGSAVHGRLTAAGLEREAAEREQPPSGNQRPPATVGVPGRSEPVDVPAVAAPIHRGFAGDGHKYPPVFEVIKAPGKAS